MPATTEILDFPILYPSPITEFFKQEPIKILVEHIGTSSEELIADTFNENLGLVDNVVINRHSNTAIVYLKSLHYIPKSEFNPMDYLSQNKSHKIDIHVGSQLWQISKV